MRIGVVTLAAGEERPRNREELKKELRRLGLSAGLRGVYFVKLKRWGNYAGYHNMNKSTIVVVDQVGKKKVPKEDLIFSFLHELAHHIQATSGMFLPFFYAALRREDGTIQRFTKKDVIRVALRAERHADRSALKMAKELYGLEYELKSPYPEDFLREHIDKYFQE